MFRAMFRSLLIHRLRLVLTGLAIALGVAFMSGSFIFSATLSHSLNSLFAQASNGIDVEVTHAGPNESVLAGNPARPLPASVLHTIRGVQGVAAADGQVIAGTVLLGRNGKPLQASAVAFSWPVDSPFQAAFSSRTGQPPVRPGQVMIDRASARRGHFAIGDSIGIEVAGRSVRFTITGITGYGSADSIGGESMAIFSLGTAQRLFGQAGQFSQIIVKAAPGVTATQLRDRVAAVLPPADRAVTAATAAATAAEQTSSNLGVLRDFFLGFAVIALVVGAFVIWNTFSILVGQRTRELALTRALGASTGQAFGSVLAEAAIIAVVASVVGAGLGLLTAKALGALLGTFGLSLPLGGLQLPVADLVISIVTGIVITLIASLAPAWRATRIAPVQAMRDPAPEPTRVGKGRLVTGLALVAAGAAALLAGISSSGAGALTGAGAACGFIGVLVLAPVLVRPLAYLAGAPLIRLPAQVGVLARGNTVRNPKRTSATAAALMIGVAVITLTSVLVSSADALVARQINATSRTQFYVRAATGSDGLTPALASVIARQPGVRAVSEIRLTHATVAGSDRSVNGVDPATIGQLTDLGVTAGSVAALSQPGTIMVSGTGFRLGQRLRVHFGAYGTHSMRVVAKFTDTAPLNAFLISNSTMAADSGVRTDETILVRAAGRAREPIRAALAQYPGATLLDHTGFIASETSKLGTLLNLVRALLILAIVIALLGVVNTLILSVSERTREIGLMRAIGMHRGQLRQIVAAESMIISAIGALLGVILGIGLGAALAAALTKSEQLTVAIPVGQLIIYVLGTAAVGVLASIGPARRAARLDLLTAIAAE